MSSATLALPRTRQVKVMFVDHTAKMSGGEIAMLRLIAAIDPTRYKISVVLFSDGELTGALQKLGVQTIVLPLASDVLAARKESIKASALLRIGSVRRTFAHIMALKRLIEQESPDIVHTNSLKADIIGGIAGRLAGVPVIWHIRDRIAPDYLPSFAATLFRLLSRFIPNYVVANSQATMRTLGLPVAGHNTTVVYGGLNSDDESELSGTLGFRTPASVLYDGLAKQNSPPHPHAEPTSTVGLIGRISPWKGQHVFIEAAALVLRQLPHTRFEIIGSQMFGEEEYLHKLHSQIESLGLSDAVKLVGFQSDIPAVLSRLNVFVHASVLPEPFGQTVLEAMAAGVPTIATNAGAIPEIVTHEETGLLVTPGDPLAMADAIIRLLGDRHFAERIAAKGKQTAHERFNIVSAAYNMQKIYEHLVGTKGAPRAEL